jgi:hypothetical protein
MNAGRSDPPCVIPVSDRAQSDLNAVGRAIVIENKWRVQRYGVHGTFVEESGPIGNLGPTPDVIVFGLEQLPINGVAP